MKRIGYLIFGIIINVPEALNIDMNEIYKKLATIKSNKLRFKRVLNKMTFVSRKLIFYCLKKKSF